MQREFQRRAADLHLTPESPAIALAPVLDAVIGPHRGGWERGVGAGAHRAALRHGSIHDAGVATIQMDVTLRADAQLQGMSDTVGQLERTVQEQQRTIQDLEARRLEEEERRRQEEERRRQEEEERARQREEERRQSEERFRRLEELVLTLAGGRGGGSSSQP